MTKQEYEAKNQQLRDAYICDSDYFGRLVDVDSEYIESLEAENAKLEKALDKAVEILADEGAIFCPAIKVGYICNDGKGCDKLDSCETDICWREYLMKEATNETMP